MKNKPQVFNETDFTRVMFQRMRYLKEEAGQQMPQADAPEQTTSEEVKIPQNDMYFTELKTNIQKFVGAIKTDDNSLIVYPADSDVTFSGEIIGLNNLKFQFRYNDQSGGLYIWGDSVLLTKDVADKLAKLVVLKDQWKTSWDEKITEYTK
jgi:hypothetical protein